MASIDDDASYRNLRNEVKSKEIRATILGSISSALVLGLAAGAYYLAPWAAGSTALSATTMAVGGVAAAAAVVTGWMGWKQGIELNYDKQELETRRSAANFSQILQNPSLTPAQAVVVSHEMNRVDNNRWRKAEQERQAGRTTQTGEMAP